MLLRILIVMEAKIICGEAIETMASLPECFRVNACITDVPYGTTACAWDTVIPFEPMWKELKHIVLQNGAIVLFGSQPFTSALVMSNPSMFKHDIVWHKTRSTGHLNCNVEPMREHEDLIVFADGRVTYNPQITGKPADKVRPFSGRSLTDAYGVYDPQAERLIPIDMSYPRSILKLNNCNHGEWGLHPTQKPVELMRYLVRTYTNEGDTVLDFTCGSGSTGVACAIENRNFIGIEQDAHYCDVARARIARAQGKPADIPRRPSDKDYPLFTQEQT